MKIKPNETLAQAGDGIVKRTVGHGRINGVGERAHIRIGRREARRTPDAPRHDAREIRSAARRAGHRPPAVALTRVRVARSACAQHRRVHREALCLERAETRGEVHNAHSGVEQHTGRVASCVRM